MTHLRELDDLPEAQQKALFLILDLKKPSFRTSEVIKEMDGSVSGRSVGAVLGSLYKNGYLEKIQGGRDKMWKLSEKAEQSHRDIKEKFNKVKAYWS